MEEKKKENVFKKVANSKVTKTIVQVGTTLLALADTAFIIWTCFDSKAAPAVEPQKIVDDTPFQTEEI